jgi:hypothetical protein
MGNINTPKFNSFNNSEVIIRPFEFNPRYPTDD